MLNLFITSPYSSLYLVVGMYSCIMQIPTGFPFSFTVIGRSSSKHTFSTDLVYCRFCYSFTCWYR